jgi:hypothetical protein
LPLLNIERWTFVVGCSCSPPTAFHPLTFRRNENQCDVLATRLIPPNRDGSQASIPPGNPERVGIIQSSACPMRRFRSIHTLRATRNGLESFSPGLAAEAYPGYSFWKPPTPTRVESKPHTGQPGTQIPRQTHSNPLIWKPMILQAKVECYGCRISRSATSEAFVWSPVFRRCSIQMEGSLYISNPLDNPMARAIS